MTTADSTEVLDTAIPGCNPVHEFGILLSRYCNASCEHCGSSSGPDQGERLPPGLAERVVDEVAAAGLTSIGFTGGEPLVFKRRVVNLVAQATAAGLRSTVHSNGYWADDESRAARWAADLAEAGLATLVLSTDRWHLPFIPFDSVVNGALAAEAAGIEVQVKIPSARSDLVALKLLTRLQQLTSAVVMIHPVHPVGRGADLPAGLLPGTDVGFGGCHVVGHLEVDGDGTVAVCPASADFPTTSPLRLGSALDHDVGDLIERYRRTPLFAVIAATGPLAIHVLAGGSSDLSDRAVGPRPHACHLCRSVHLDTTFLDQVARHSGLDLLTPVDPDHFASILASALAVIHDAQASPVQVRVP